MPIIPGATVEDCGVHEILQLRKKAVDEKKDDACRIQESSFGPGRGLGGSEVSAKRGTDHLQKDGSLVEQELIIFYEKRC